MLVGNITDGARSTSAEAVRAIINEQHADKKPSIFSMSPGLR